jgi:hypothetical protein
MIEEGEHSDLIDMEVTRAMEMKFERGREKYGSTEWVGPSPLFCAHDECLDLLAYLNRAKAEGLLDEELAYNLIKSGIDMVRGVRVAIGIAYGGEVKK